MSTAESEELQALRAEIDAVDRELVDALLRRKGLVDRVAGVKRAQGLPLYHPAREEDLISQRRQQASSHGLDPDLVEDLFRRILRESRTSQSTALASHCVRPGTAIVIVGGGGSMGRCLGCWFGGAGYEVRVLEREGWERAAELCRDVALAVLSVPIDVTEAVARRLGPLLPPGCVLADVTSVKAGPLAAMLAAHRGPVLGLHPMFGPTTTNIDKQVVVVTPGREEGACRWILDQLEAWGAVTVRASAEEHDRAMAVVQALRHFATFAFGRFLWEKGVDLERTLDFSAPIYRLELGMVGRLFAQDPLLYAEIIFATPERRQLLREYADSLAEMARLADRSGKEGFCEEFRKVAAWFGPFSDQAMRESSYLIEKLVERF